MKQSGVDSGMDQIGATEEEGRGIIVAYVERLLRKRIVRYALVGGIGIPVQVLALAVFLHLLGEKLYPVALVLSFEVSTTVNFVLNQRFTYSEQKHLHGWDWPKRALAAQLSSASALAISIGISLVLKYGLGVNEYLASPIGIVCAFFYNFTISNRFVFRPAQAQQDSKSAAK